MDEILSIYNTRLRTASITVTRQYRTTSKLLCYKHDLRQAFANLIHNSLDATRSGGRLLIRISDARSRTDENVRGIRVTVADTGEGIIPANMGRLFEPFFSTRGITRTGLALWVTDQIIRKHRGRITCRSRTGAPHCGTMFSVFLPFDGIANKETSDKEGPTPLRGC